MVVIASIPAFTYDFVHNVCKHASRLNYIHGFAGQKLEHGSFFKDWQGMVRGFVEAQLRQYEIRDLTVIGVEGGPCSMEEADLMPQLLMNIQENVESLGDSGFMIRWRYYINFEDFKSDIEAWKGRTKTLYQGLEIEGLAGQTKVTGTARTSLVLRAVLCILFVAASVMSFGRETDQLAVDEGGAVCPRGYANATDKSLCGADDLRYTGRFCCEGARSDQCDMTCAKARCMAAGGQWSGHPDLYICLAIKCPAGFFRVEAHTNLTCT